MKLGVAFREHLEGISTMLVQELDRAYAVIRATWNVEHRSDGSHGAVIADSYTERGRTTMIGEWADVPFSSSNYGASGSMTWSVTSGDVLTNRKMRAGNTLWWTFALASTTVGGVVSTELQIALPDSLRSRKFTVTTIAVDDNGTTGVGRAAISEGASVLRLSKADGSNWTLSTNATEIFGQIAIDVFSD